MTAEVVALITIGLALWIVGVGTVEKGRRSYEALRRAGALPVGEGQGLPTWQRLLLGSKARTFPVSLRRLALRSFVLITTATGCFGAAWMIYHS
jgi:hypothetical protein